MVASTGPGCAWTTGLVLGTLSAVVLLELGVFGAAFAVVAVALIAWKGPRLIAAGGLLVGLGGTLMLLFGRVWLSCAAENATPGTGCEAPGIDVWVGAALVMLAGGILTTGVAVRRARPR